MLLLLLIRSDMSSLKAFSWPDESALVVLATSRLVTEPDTKRSLLVDLLLVGIIVCVVKGGGFAVELEVALLLTSIVVCVVVVAASARLSLAACWPVSLLSS